MMFRFAQHGKFLCVIASEAKQSNGMKSPNKESPRKSARKAMAKP